MTESEPTGGMERAASRAGRFVSDFRRIQAREKAKDQRQNKARSAKSGSEPDFDPTSWSGALLLMAGFTAVLWVVEIVNHSQHQRLDRFGLLPRHIDGLWGVLTQPFLHQSYGQLFSNTLPVLLIGWVLLLSGVRTWLFVTASVTIVGGFATWVVAPSEHVILGASTLVFGWMGYLLARAFFSRKLKWIFTAIALLVFFGTLLGSLLPSVDRQTAWQSHVCGFAAGVFVGWLLHPRAPHHPNRSGSNPAVR